ncbi:hypothetical protein Misp01_54330 [Microtetraspora sp. NBRC 13810]|uniref:hypothetical protein n=1 Tax=Microtetraspora sp. NBRC 13810 TaxID=3030990 RepID=UPI0024A473FB|nr:hypothetical protein [Microtetraspora sp. NBRC 13810]GLW10305.1 hypothetical protein Misp01_54330 [Microtetraspora sp. NBRC 13810]
MLLDFAQKPPRKTTETPPLYSDWMRVYCTTENVAAVESPEGLRGYPHNKVAKRINNGTEHDLEASSSTPSQVRHRVGQLLVSSGLHGDND